MDNVLKPCPFCGGKAYIQKLTSGYTGSGEFIAGYEVGCKTCNIKFKAESRFALIDGQPVFKTNGYDRCVEQWNRRADNG